MDKKKTTISEETLQELVTIFGETWEQARKEIGRGIAEPGTKRRKALTAALHHIGVTITPSQPATPPTEDEEPYILEVTTLQGNTVRIDLERKEPAHPPLDQKYKLPVKVTPATHPGPSHKKHHKEAPKQGGTT